MKRKTFDHIFFKYLISYLLILLIPILFINGLFGHRFMKAYKKEIQEQANNDLINLGQMMDSELQTIATTAARERQLNISATRQRKPRAATAEQSASMNARIVKTVRAR